MSYSFDQAWKDFQPKSRPLTVEEIAEAILASGKLDTLSALLGENYPGRYNSAYNTEKEYVEGRTRAVAYELAPLIVSLTPLLSLETVNLID